MKALNLLPILAVCTSLAGCATGPAQLDASDVQRLSAMQPVAVVYVDPIAVLDGNLSGQGQRQEDLGAQLGDLRLISKFKTQLEPYQPRAQQLGVADRQYEAVHAALSAVPWLKDATWTRIRKTDADFNEFNFQLATSEKAVGRVVIVIEAGATLYSYVDELHTSVNLDIYTKKVATSTDRPAHFTSDRLDGVADLGNPGPELGSNGRQPPEAEVKDRLDRLFGGDPAPFADDLDMALTSLKRQLTGYFSGTNQ
ncbi:MAG TPA: hypothetical protein VLV87_02880 [Gammaproteobacteria bacterium]|nr:hypothetical protein [Gammaproteobacteria bacterium]